MRDWACAQGAGTNAAERTMTVKKIAVTQRVIFTPMLHKNIHIILFEFKSLKVILAFFRNLLQVISR